MKLINKIFLASSLFFFSCQSPDIKDFSFNNGDNKCEPSYFENYQRKQNEIVGIGIAPMNINGIDAQRKSAISKAIDEIARQLGVTVSTITKSKTSMSNGQVSRYYNNYSLQTVNGNKVNAKIVKACKAEDGNFYVLMKAYK